MVTTRTLCSVYLSPKNASAPEASASSSEVTFVSICVFRRISSFTCCSMSQLFGIHMREVRKVKAQPVGSIQRAGLFHMRSENIPQCRIHQVRPRVIADNPPPSLRIRDHSYAIPDP